MAQDGSPTTTGDSSHDAEDTQQSSQAADQEKQTKKTRRKRIAMVLGAIAVIVAIVIGVRMWIHSRDYVSTDDAFIDAQVVRIAPQIAGRVQALPVVDNQLVAAGELLVEISANDVQPRVARNAAGIRAAQAKLAQARTTVATAQAACDAARNQAGEPAAQVSKAQDQVNRLEAARRLDAATVATLQLEQAQADLRNARAALSSAQANARQVCSQQAGAQQDVQAAQAQIASAQAEADASQVTMGQTRITAPFAGYIANLSANIGSYVQPGTQIMALVPTHIYVTANFKETDLYRMKVGDPVSIKVDAYPDLEFEGKIASFQHAAGAEFALLPPQNSTGNYVKVVQRVAVRIEFTKPLPKGIVLGPGMSVVPSVRVR